MALRIPGPPLVAGALLLLVTSCARSGQTDAVGERPFAFSLPECPPGMLAIPDTLFVGMSPAEVERRLEGLGLGPQEEVRLVVRFPARQRAEQSVTGPWIQNWHTVAENFRRQQEMGSRRRDFALPRAAEVMVLVDASGGLLGARVVPSLDARAPSHEARQAVRRGDFVPAVYHNCRTASVRTMIIHPARGF